MTHGQRSPHVALVVPLAGKGTVYGPSQCPDAVYDIIDGIYREHGVCVGDQVTVFSGTGVQLGLESTWRFSVAWNGAFREEVKTDKFTTISGFDGAPESRSWSGDHTGLSQSLELDDHELTVLVNWVRSGVWSSPALRHTLDIDLISTSGDDGSICIRIRLENGRVNGMLTVDEDTLQIVNIDFDLRSDSEVLQFLDWKSWNIDANVMTYPERIQYDTMSGTNLLNVGSIQRRMSSSWQDFVIPDPIPMALDTVCSHTRYKLPAWVTNSGHILVKAMIDGQDSGYWLFDTGASGSVIDSSAAKSFDLETFGSFKVKGMAGDLDGTFRECKSMELGPLRVSNMLMMEMDCSGLVRGGPGPIVGIIGCDIMSRAVFDIPQVVQAEPVSPDNQIYVSSPAAAMAFSTLESRTNKIKGCQEIEIDMYDPREEVEIDDPAKWMNVRWVSSLPHLGIQCTNGTTTQEILFMVDSGAGGMQLMMNGLTASHLHLLSDQQRSKGTRTVRGVGGSSGSNIKLSSVKLDDIRIGDHIIDNVDCLVAAEGTSGGVELSHYTGGVLCNDILIRYRFVIDLPRDRLALLSD